MKRRIHRRYYSKYIALFISSSSVRISTFRSSVHPAGSLEDEEVGSAELWVQTAAF